MGRVPALALLVVAALAGRARADDILYVEALGKAGPYGLGYEHSIDKRIAIGAAASFISLEGQQLYTFAPYIHGTLVGAHRHRLFTELGAVLAHSRIPSPVSDWDGMTDTGGGGFLSLGYEYTRGHFLVRASGSVVAGEGGLAPMIGIAIGAHL
jgi:hypothetical protein